MNTQRKRRLYLVVMLIIGVSIAAGLTLYALSQNISLFYSPTQIVSGEAPKNARIRAGGMVVKGSVQRDPNSLKVTFELTDYIDTITVTYTGILPDLFREGQGIVAQGSLNNSGIFRAVEVLAKHDETYMPPEVADALKAAKPLQQEEPEKAGQPLYKSLQQGLKP